MVWNLYGDIGEFKNFNENDFDPCLEQKKALLLANSHSDIVIFLQKSFSGEVKKKTTASSSHIYEHTFEEQQAYPIICEVSVIYPKKYSSQIESLLSKINGIEPSGGYVEDIADNDTEQSCRFRYHYSGPEISEYSVYKERKCCPFHVKKVLSLVSDDLLDNHPIPEVLLEHVSLLASQYTVEESIFVKTLNHCTVESIHDLFDDVLVQAKNLCLDNPIYAPFLYMLYIKCRELGELELQTQVAEHINYDLDYYGSTDVAYELGHLFFVESSYEKDPDKHLTYKEKSSYYLLASIYKNPENIKLLARNLLSLMYGEGGTKLMESGEEAHELMSITNDIFEKAIEESSQNPSGEIDIGLSWVSKTLTLMANNHGKLYAKNKALEEKVQQLERKELLFSSSSDTDDQMCMNRKQVKKQMVAKMLKR